MGLSKQTGVLRGIQTGEPTWNQQYLVPILKIMVDNIHFISIPIFRGRGDEKPGACGRVGKKEPGIKGKTLLWTLSQKLILSAVAVSHIASTFKNMMITMYSVSVFIIQLTHEPFCDPGKQFYTKQVKTSVGMQNSCQCHICSSCVSCCVYGKLTHLIPHTTQLPSASYLPV